MRFELVYTLRAIRDIRALPALVQRRIAAALVKYSKDPYVHSEKLSDSKIGGYRFRIGDYRVIVDIERSEIVVLRVGHRREIYRKRGSRA